MTVFQPGQPAPDFELPAADGSTVRLSDFRGRKVVLYFYPKAMTELCAKQSCDFQDAGKKFRRHNAVVLGVSADPAKAHVKFAAKYGLTFPLLSDPEHVVCERYGVWQEKKLYGRTYMGIVRSTFLIDEEGRLLREWRGVKVKGHVEEVLRATEQAASSVR